MYKIYINDTPIFLIAKAEVDLKKADKRNLIGEYRGKKKFLLNYVDLLEKSSHLDSVTLYAADFQGLVEDFRSHFKILEASRRGGL